MREGAPLRSGVLQARARGRKCPPGPAGLVQSMASQPGRVPGIELGSLRGSASALASSALLSPTFRSQTRGLGSGQRLHLSRESDAGVQRIPPRRPGQSYWSWALGRSFSAPTAGWGLEAQPVLIYTAPGEGPGHPAVLVPAAQRGDGGGLRPEAHNCRASRVGVAPQGPGRWRQVPGQPPGVGGTGGEGVCLLPGQLGLQASLGTKAWMTLSACSPAGSPLIFQAQRTRGTCL